jgi:hypothetical protein
LDAIIVWKVSVDSRKVSTICASMMGPVTLSRGSSLKMGVPSGTAQTSPVEAEGFQVVEESVADVSERRVSTKEADVLGLETNVFQEVEGLLESGGKEIAALRRQRAHEKFEAGGGAEAVLKIGRRHGELVKVREQGRMAKGFGHEEASGKL